LRQDRPLKMARTQIASRPMFITFWWMNALNRSWNGPPTLKTVNTPERCSDRQVFLWSWRGKSWRRQNETLGVSMNGCERSAAPIPFSWTARSESNTWTIEILYRSTIEFRSSGPFRHVSLRAVWHIP
jgi:hypothetical protein